MKRQLLLITILLLLALDTFAQKGLPKLVIPETEKRLLSVKPHSVNPVTYTLLNGGEAPLTIEKISTTCGCTLASIASRTIPPDGETKLNVVFTSGNQKEIVSHRIQLVTNDPENQEVTLSLVAEIEPDVVWEPRVFNLNWPIISDYLGKIILRNETGNIVRVKKVYTKAGLLQTSVRKEVGFDAEINFTIPHDSQYHASDTIFIESDSVDFPLITIPVYFAREQQVLTMVSGQVFQAFPGYSELKKQIIVYRRDKGKVHIVAAVSSNDFFLTKILRNDADECLVEVTLKSGLNVCFCDGYIEIVTDAGTINENIACKIISPPDDM